MPPSEKPLTLPSENGFAGIWAAGKEKLQITLKELVEVHNACVKMREIGMPPKGGGWAFPELTPFKPKVWQLLEKWKYRLEKIVKPANRVECLEEDENADRIPRLFLKTWDKKKTANAQDDFITDTYVTSLQLAHIREDVSFAEFYEETYKKLPKVKTELKTVDEVQDLAMICILEYKVLGGCDLQWREKAAETSSFLRDAAAGADDDAPAGASQSSTGSRRSKQDKDKVAAPPASGDGASAPNKEGAAVASAPAAAAPDTERERDKILDMEDIVSWSWNADEFPLNQVASMKFDGSRSLAEQRTFHAAAILLFYRKRTEEQERIFRDLTGVWGNARGTHIRHALLSHPPTAGPTIYSPGEVEWCQNAQTALIAQMDSALRKELEIPEPAQSSRRRSGRGDSLEGEAGRLQPSK